MNVMKSAWNDSEALEYVKKFGGSLGGEDIALRVYTSRLIGRDPNLVLHGGGNTSVKLSVKLETDDELVEFIAVKGSGWELSDIEPRGLPCVDLNHCRKLRKLNKLDDEAMVNHLRTHMLDYSSPTPSVETLLHAFLPHKFVDHSHADAILAIVDQPDDVSIKICKELYGDTFGIVPYIMPGFDLAKLAAQVYESNPSVQGLLLLKHGIFTFGETAKESYERHIAAVAKAQQYILSMKKKQLTPSFESDLTTEMILLKSLPELRQVFSKHSNGVHWVFTHRKSEKALAFANCCEVMDWSQRGPLTPDHVIRTKGFPLVIKGLHDFIIRKDKNGLKQHLESQLKSYIDNYHDYFKRQNDASSVKKIELDPLPRVILVPGVGLVTVGRTYKEASIAADIYEHTIDTIHNAMSVGSYEPVSEKDRFDMEYWSLEQAKLGKTKPAALEGQVVYITGGASGIGLACAHVFGKAGASLFLTDMNAESLGKAAKELQALRIPTQFCQVDITSFQQVKKSFQQAILSYGGVDILINNAGKSFICQGMASCKEEMLKESLNVNLIGHQLCASAATKIMMRQGNGLLLFNVSKAALNPGKNFGPYCVAKAATLALMKQYALEYAEYGIRSNAVNADRVHTNFFSEDLIKERAAARKLPPSEYFKANLLHIEVEATDVANAFLHLTMSPKTTAAVLTVDGGNIEASVR